ncbi:MULTISPECIES: cellulose synthase catalytic subunit [Spirulina sp. CCY15215]|uniref:glycosyltransferase family 2 protein n=1 Tax=Spirulina sp. CCY15215 TaxID=2767591 RepID=UPI0019517323|nr:cellulose synthase catalytic subunit [Spirulina major]
MFSSSPKNARKEHKKKNNTKNRNSPQLTTLIFLSSIAFILCILAAWALDIAPISQFFTKLSTIENDLPLVFRSLLYPDRYGTLIVMGLLVGLLAIVKIFPQPNRLLYIAVVPILLVFALRYLFWRFFSTLNLENPVSGTLSLALFLLETFLFIDYGLQTFLVLSKRDRREDADRFEREAIENNYLPSVDILIPTYNEPEFVLKRTIIGCQAINYSDKEIYLLDDSKRENIRQLAHQLGCHYLTRSDNNYAKAGNLNHGLSQSQGELIAVFDADFVPTQNFLSRTIGFFQRPNIGLLQTHQYFYNHDLIPINLGIENEISSENEFFGRHYQKLRDSADTSLCYGSAFLIRRDILEESGSFVTSSLSEDYFTGVRLNSLGYQTIYLDEELSAGLAAENLSGYISQRQRWCRGTLQALFIPENPLTIANLTLRQRILHGAGIFQWLLPISRLIFLVLPISFFFIDAIPFKITLFEWLNFFLPFYLSYLLSFSWLNQRSREALISDIYAVVQCVPLSITTIQTLLNPFSQGFQVTPKGIAKDRFLFNWSLAIPLIPIFLINLAGTGHIFYIFCTKFTDFLNYSSEERTLFMLSIFWGFYNLLILSIALLSMLESPQSNSFPWFELKRLIRLKVGERVFSGITQTLSEIGAEIELKEPFSMDITDENTAVSLEIVGENLELWGTLTRDRNSLRITFQEMTLEQNRGLIQLLFCRPGQWKRTKCSGELRVFWLLLKSLIKPKILTGNRKIYPISVNS